MGDRKEPIAIEDARLLTRQQVAELIGVSPDCLKRWAARRKGPGFLKWSEREVRYRLVDVVTWENQLATMEPKQL